MNMCDKFILDDLKNNKLCFNDTIRYLCHKVLFLEDCSDVLCKQIDINNNTIFDYMIVYYDDVLLELEKIHCDLNQNLKKYISCKKKFITLFEKKLFNRECLKECLLGNSKLLNYLCENNNHSVCLILLCIGKNLGVVNSNSIINLGGKKLSFDALYDKCKKKCDKSSNKKNFNYPGVFCKLFNWLNNDKSSNNNDNNDNNDNEDSDDETKNDFDNVAKIEINILINSTEENYDYQENFFTDVQNNIFEESNYNQLIYNELDTEMAIDQIKKLIEKDNPPNLTNNNNIKHLTNNNSDTEIDTEHAFNELKKKFNKNNLPNPTNNNNVKSLALDTESDFNLNIPQSVIDTPQLLEALTGNKNPHPNPSHHFNNIKSSHPNPSQLNNRHPKSNDDNNVVKELQSLKHQLDTKNNDMYGNLLYDNNGDIGIETEKALADLLGGADCGCSR